MSEYRTCACCGREYQPAPETLAKHREHRNYVWMCGTCLAPTRNVNSPDNDGYANVSWGEEPCRKSNQVHLASNYSARTRRMPKPAKT